MEFKAILFDLDGTLLPMDYDTFFGAYFKLLLKKLAPLGHPSQEMMDRLWDSIVCMMKNDGSETNEARFWRTFFERHGMPEESKELFDAYYRDDFCQLRSVCGCNPAAQELVALLRQKGIPLVLATNPVFPDTATVQRMEWAGLRCEDFVLRTTYENSCFCKPNLNYYREILQELDLAPEQCLMVGNDAHEDMIAAELGMQVFLLTDFLVNKKQRDLSALPQGGFAQLKQYLAPML